MESLNEVNDPQGAEEESFASFPEPSNQLVAEEAPLNELRLLMRVEREDSHPLPVGTYSERCVYQKVERLTGIVPERVRRINVFDTIIEFAADVSVVAIIQALHSVRNWEDNPVQISCILGSGPYITEVCRQRNIIIEQQSELHQQEEQHRRNLREREIEMERQTIQYKEELARQAEEMRSDASSQRATIAELAHRMDHQASLINKLREEHSQVESIPRISSSIVTPDVATGLEVRKMTRNPDLPIFSGEKPTPKQEVEYDNWIFQVKNLRKTYTDDAIKNGVVARVRGVANLIVRSAGYESTLDHIIQCLDDKFSHSETDDCLLQEFHQMQQGIKEGVLEYGSKLECKFRFLQERFPDRYDDSQLRDRFFSSVVNRTRDAIRHKHDNPESTFNELLTAAMKAEAEATQRSAQAKAFNAETDTNPEITSIQKQLTSMTDIIKSARFQDRDHKRKGDNTAKAAEIRENQRTPSGTPKKVKPPLQCHRCMGWGHFIRNCASKAPIEGSVEWEQTHGNSHQGGDSNSERK